MLMGKHVNLRSPQKEDSVEYFEWINNRELVMLNSPYKPISWEAHSAWFQSLNKDQTFETFSIVENKSCSLIGSCSLRHIDLIHRNAELQIRIGNADFLGKGLGSDATLILLDHAFKDLNLKRVYLHVFESNKRAIAAYEKCGFIKEGLLQQAAYINGEYINILLMAKLNG